MSRILGLAALFLPLIMIYTCRSNYFEVQYTCLLNIFSSHRSNLVRAVRVYIQHVYLFVVDCKMSIRGQLKFIGTSLTKNPVCGTISKYTMGSGGSAICCVSLFSYDSWYFVILIQLRFTIYLGFVIMIQLRFTPYSGFSQHSWWSRFRIESFRYLILYHIRV